MAKDIEILEEWPEWKRSIAEAINAQGMSMKEASLAAGLNETFIRDVLKRGKQPSVQNLRKIQSALSIPKDDAIPLSQRRADMPVAGVAKAGVFHDVSIIDEDNFGEKPTIPVATDPRFAHARQYALEVNGDSMNKVFNDGDFVICAAWGDIGLSPKPGMIVHVERRIDSALVETTVKQLIRGDDTLLLAPDSTNPNHKPLELDNGSGAEVMIVGLVIGVWKPINF